MSVGAYNRRWYLNSQDRGQAGVGGGGGGGGGLLNHL